MARRAVETASAKQAIDIVLLDTKGVCSFADYFVICSGDSTRQIKAILEEIEAEIKKQGQLPAHREGTADSGWMLLDYGNVIVHIFAPTQREYYQLEKLWDRANLVLRIH